jgi:predicted DNA-binding transcriptional regulator AlpA
MAKQETTAAPAAASPPQQPIKFLSKQEVLAITGISNALLWQLIRDGHFPAGRELGNRPGGNRSKIAWIDAEIHEWMWNRPRRQPKGAAELYGHQPDQQQHEYRETPIARATRLRLGKESKKKGSGR